MKVKQKIAAMGLFLAVFLTGCTGMIADIPKKEMQNQVSLEQEVLEEQKERAEVSGRRGNTQYNADPEGLLTVTFLNIGQGNSILVENDGLYMLIDGGDREYSSYVVSYLQSQGVEELEYVISSHYDADHLNGIIGALHVFPCETLLAADYTTDTKVYKSLLSVIEEKDIPVEYPKLGDTYTFGDAQFTIVSPDRYDYAEDNDNSVGIRLVYGENSFLICGDAGTRMEQMMIQSGLPLESDVYLASHHGSAYSSSEAFLDAVRPEAVVISAGLSNTYGHPTKEVLDLVEERQSSLYRTDLQGEIIVTSDGSNLNWNVEPSTDFRDGRELADSGYEKKKKPSGGNSVGGGAKLNEREQQSNGILGEGGNTYQTDLYIMNLNTKKFHKPSCTSVSDMNVENRAEFHGSREELIEGGYDPCGRCHP